MTSLARALLAELDDAALAELAELLTPHLQGLTRGEATVPISYTVSGLAAAVGVSEKVIRGAIHRGELAAVRRGARFIIAGEAAHAWVSPSPNGRLRTTPARPRSVRKHRLADVLAGIE